MSLPVFLPFASMRAWLTMAAVFACLGFPFALDAKEPMRFIHAASESREDDRFTYHWKLLEAALESNRHIYGDFTIERYPIAMNDARNEAEMALGDRGRVNIFVPATNPELEQKLLPIRIPVDKGLLGFRVFLIMAETQDKLNSVRTIDDLRQFSIGQGTPWTDTRILRLNGFKLVTTNDYGGLFKMLEARRFDLFSRGIDEVQSELRQHKPRSPSLQVEQHLLLHYPMPRYYFVPRTPLGERMAARIEDGMHRLAQSGEFDRQYAAFKHKVLAGLDLRNRLLIEIPNPLLAPAIPLTNKQWWDDLSDELGPSVKHAPRHGRRDKTVRDLN